MSQIDAVLFSEEAKKILGEFPLKDTDTEVTAASAEDNEEEEESRPVDADGPGVELKTDEFLNTSDISLKLDLEGVLNDSTAQFDIDIPNASVSDIFHVPVC